MSVSKSRPKKSRPAVEVVGVRHDRTDHVYSPGWEGIKLAAYDGPAAPKADPLREAVNLLVETLIASPYGVKDITGTGYRIYRDGSITGTSAVGLDDGFDENEYDCTWDEFASNVQASDVTEAIHELLP